MAGFKNLKRSRAPAEEEDGSDLDTKPSKTNKKTKSAGSAPESGKDAEGNSYWGLSAKRRIGISKFKGQVFINIREYWSDNNGDLKPGKKGISLSIDQYNAFLQAIPAINDELTSEGHDIVSVSSTTPTTTTTSTTVNKSDSKDKKKGAKKANIEATSDEDNDGEQDEEASD
ncbi:transcriptional Coactivator p15-domain-containing protein [Xylariales sp. PMI_506]|nr:transcriptional Coactivator p15-domain-containing protein [Xylariales sp. PMI_506]